MLKRIKAMKVMAAKDLMYHGSAIVWPVYDGDNAIEAKQMHDYIQGFFVSGELMPVPGYTLRLNVLSLETEYDEITKRHKVVAEGELR